MSNPDKSWSWRAALGRATGGAVGAGAAGAAMGALGGAAGIALGGAIGAAGGFCGSFIGSALGHWWDDPPKVLESFRSGALYTLVVSGTLASLLGFLALSQLSVHLDIFERGMFAISTLSGFLGSASRSLIDDFRAAEQQRRFMA